MNITGDIMSTRTVQTASQRLEYPAIRCYAYPGQFNPTSNNATATLTSHARPHIISPSVPTSNGMQTPATPDNAVLRHVTFRRQLKQSLAMIIRLGDSNMLQVRTLRRPLSSHSPLRLHSLQAHHLVMYQDFPAVLLACPPDSQTTRCD